MKCIIPYCGVLTAISQQDAAHSHLVKVESGDCFFLTVFMCDVQICNKNMQTRKQRLRGHIQLVHVLCVTEDKL